MAAPPPPGLAATPSQLEQSFRDFLALPENLNLAERALAEEARDAQLAAELKADARLRAAAAGLRPRERRRVDPALRLALGGGASRSLPPPSPALRGVLLSLCNAGPGGEEGDDPEGDAARLQAWLVNPRVMDMLRRAAAAVVVEGRGEAASAASAAPPPLLDRLLLAASSRESPDSNPSPLRLPTHELVDALNEHARLMALGRAAGDADSALAHFAQAAARLSLLEPEDDNNNCPSATRELGMARASACAAQADVCASGGRWDEVKRHAGEGVAALSSSPSSPLLLHHALASLLLRRCHALIELGDLDAAKADLKRAMEEAGRAGAGALRAWRQQAAGLDARLRRSAAATKEEQRALYARMLRGL